MNTCALVRRAAEAAVMLSALGAVPAGAALRTPRPSPDATLKQTVGITDLTLTYSRPGVKGREVWGKLVPYGKPWRTGANEATTITTSTDVTVNGLPLPKGKYSFFTIPTVGAWTLVFSRQQEQWGAFDYDSTQDALRVTLAPEPADFQEWMGFEFDSLTAQSARVSLRWEKLRVPFKVVANTPELVLVLAREGIAAAKADDWATPYQGARYAFENNVGNAGEASAWLEKSLKLKENYQTLFLKARMLAKGGNKTDAITMGEKAVKLEKDRKLEKGDERADTAPLEKMIVEWKSK